MIGQLRGNLLIKQAPKIILDVMGVGYEVFVSMHTIYKLPEINQQVILYTHMIVREDGMHLFGFVDESERILFKQLIKISGVGPKLALAILSALEPKLLFHCIEQQDAAMLKKVPGVGAKTAQRLLLELQDHLKKLPMYSEIILYNQNASANGGMNAGDSINSKNTAAMASVIAKQDAISALVALGYTKNDASRVIQQISSDVENLSEQDKEQLKNQYSSEDLIKQALKRLAQ